MEDIVAGGLVGLVLAVGSLYFAWSLLAKRKRAAPTSHPGADRRQELRRPVGGVAVHISDADGIATPMSGTVVDCSISGVGLRVDEPLSVGAIHSFRPVKIPGNTTWALVEVKHCTQKDDHWRVGCRFIRTPPWVATLYT